MYHWTTQFGSLCKTGRRADFQPTVNNWHRTTGFSYAVTRKPGIRGQKSIEANPNYNHLLFQWGMRRTHAIRNLLTRISVRQCSNQCHDGVKAPKCNSKQQQTCQLWFQRQLGNVSTELGKIGLAPLTTVHRKTAFVCSRRTPITIQGTQLLKNMHIYMPSCFVPIPTRFQAEFWLFYLNNRKFWYICSVLIHLRNWTIIGREDA